MWSIFSRDPASSFSYDIGECCTGIEEKSIWKLHKGKRKGSGEEVSILVFDVKSSSETQHQVAKAAFKRMRTLRHPNILTYMDGLETDKVLYIVTEPVLPLITYLTEYKDDGSRSDFAISWGIHQVTRGLSFLVKDCHLVHNNICMSSIYVTKAGEWLIGGLEYMYPSQGEESVAPIKIMPLLERYNPPERVTQRLSATHEWSADMWGLGCLIWEVYNGPLSKPSDLKALGKLPKNLTGNYATLVSANPKSRPDPAAFIKDCFRKSAFMANKFVETMLFLDEIQIKDAQQKTEFFESLNAEVEKFPNSFCKHKILPQLITSFEFGNAGANVLTPLLKVGKGLDATEYQQKVVPCIVKMFSSTDRQTRVKLLQQMNMYIEYVPIPTVNDQIFPNVSLGFTDTNPLVRETTIKAILHMASRLNYKNLNEELMKHFARLQTKDDQGGIRTNTTVCLGKIACFLNPQIRQKVLPSAYLRALRDPFPPARQATLLAMIASVIYFPMQDLASRLLPSVCPLTRDPEKSVREQAFKTIDTLLERLKIVSDDPQKLEELEKDLLTTSTTLVQSQSWTGWAVTAGVSSLSSITSKFKGRSGTSAPSPSGGVPPTTNAKTSENLTKSTEKPSQVVVEDELSQNAQQAADNSDTGWNDDGWDDDDNNAWESVNNSVNTNKKVPRKAKEAWEDADWGDSGGGWGEEPDQQEEEDEEFEPIEPTKNLTSASAYNWDSSASTAQSSNDFFSNISSDDKPSVKSLHTTKPTQSGQWGSGIDDSWGADDNWGGEDSFSSTVADKKSDAEKKKQEREEKRLQRQRQLAEKRATSGKGAMKLGAKKIATD